VSSGRFATTWTGATPTLQPLAPPRTSTARPPMAGPWTNLKPGLYHDGRSATLPTS
jgi:hypothetical protein